LCAAAEQEVGDESIEQAVDAVKKAHAELDPDIQEAIDNGEDPVIDISVSYDGTWMKRGFTSKFGVGVAIDVLTGLVVDYEVSTFMSNKIC
jgi:FKBP-type peptidyl-prolyl cis-trans isomerase (trigger factor)